MRKLMLLGVLSILVFLVFLVSCSDKNSLEACLHETSMNLDKGNYDAVLASTCADPMQIGAAWFGKAGYDIKDIINRFIDANDSTESKPDLNIYMTSLTGDVTSTTLADLDNARTAYSTVSNTDSGYLDAQFYMSLVDAVKSLSVVKIAIPNTVNADGTLNLTCDQNGNGVPDEADATACALIAANNISIGTALSCSNGPTYSRSFPIDINLTDAALQPISGIYSGITVTVPVIGLGSSCGTDTYNRLLYKDGSGNYWVATTTTDSCTGSDGKTYYCPVTGSNIDFVATINTGLDNSLASLATAITGSTGDVQQSIQDIKAQACCGCITTPCAECTDTCSSEDLANYLQNNLNN